MTNRTPPHAIEATGYVGDGAQALHDDGTWKVPAGGSGIVESIVAGTGIAVDSTDPANPVVSATGGGGGGSGDAAWTTVTTLGGSWVQDATGSTVAYRKDASGFVHLKGKIKSGTMQQTAFTLPAGYRPGSTQLRPVIAGSVTAMGCLALFDTGAVQPYAGASNSYFYLDGISFYGV